MSPEGVRSVLVRWITDERPGLKEKKEKEKKQIRKRGKGCAPARAEQSYGGGHGFRPKLVGANGSAATVHGFRFRLNQEKEESDASPFQTINAVEEAVSEKVHGDAMNVLSELAELGLWATIRSATGRGGSGEEDGAHHSANSERKRLGTAASRGGRKTPVTVSLYACTDGSRSEERGTGEEKETRGSQPTTYPSAGGENVGSGERIARLRLHERERRLEERDEADAWAPLVSHWRERRRKGVGRLGRLGQK